MIHSRQNRKIQSKDKWMPGRLQLDCIAPISAIYDWNTRRELFRVDPGTSFLLLLSSSSSPSSSSIDDSPLGKCSFSSQCSACFPQAVAINMAAHTQSGHEKKKKKNSNSFSLLPLFATIQCKYEHSAHYAMCDGKPCHALPLVPSMASFNTRRMAINLCREAMNGKQRALSGSTAVAAIVVKAKNPISFVSIYSVANVSPRVHFWSELTAHLLFARNQSSLV